MQTVIPESREVIEMHVKRANMITAAWADACLEGEEPPTAMFSEEDTATEAGWVFREAVMREVTDSPDHGRGVCLVLAEKILNSIRKINGIKYGRVEFEWLPRDPDDVNTWEEVAQTVLSDIAAGDRPGAVNAFEYLLATSKDYVEVAQLIGAFVTSNYFLRNPENSSESA